MEALTLLIVLAFGSVLLALLALWLTLTVRDRAARADSEAERTSAPIRAPAAPRAPLSNDVVRGARAPRKNAPVDAGLRVGPDVAVRVRPRKDSASGEDAFERFLEPGRRDDF